MSSTVHRLRQPVRQVLSRQIPHTPHPSPERPGWCPRTHPSRSIVQNLESGVGYRVDGVADALADSRQRRGGVVAVLPEEQLGLAAASIPELLQHVQHDALLLVVVGCLFQHFYFVSIVSSHILFFNSSTVARMYMYHTSNANICPCDVEFKYMPDRFFHGEQTRNIYAILSIPPPSQKTKQKCLLHRPAYPRASSNTKNKNAPPSAMMTHSILMREKVRFRPNRVG